MRAFDNREVPQGTRFHYASSETVMLALVVRAVTGQTLANIDETVVAADGRGGRCDLAQRPRTASKPHSEISMRCCATTAASECCLPMTARPGPADRAEGLSAGSDRWRRQPDAFKPRQATSYFGYGYQFWLFPSQKRRFALLGVYGQSIFVDPELKLVMVYRRCKDRQCRARKLTAPNVMPFGADLSAITEVGERCRA